MAESSSANDFRPHPLSLNAADVTRKMKTDSTPSLWPCVRRRPRKNGTGARLYSRDRGTNITYDERTLSENVVEWLLRARHARLISDGSYASIITHSLTLRSRAMPNNCAHRDFRTATAANGPARSMQPHQRRGPKLSKGSTHAKREHTQAGRYDHNVR
jgi:hypothetical protein